MIRSIEKIKAEPISKDLRDMLADKECHGEMTGKQSATVSFLADMLDGISAARLEAICNIERAGRCVVLPDIPYNKTLYWIWGDEIMPVQYKGILGGTVTKDGVYHVSCNMTTKKPRSFVHTYRGKPYTNTILAGSKRMFYADDIGKGIFFTRTDAKAALALAKETDGH